MRRQPAGLLRTLEHAVWDAQHFLPCQCWWPSRSGSSHTKPISLNFWIDRRTALGCGTLVSGNCAWNLCWWSCVYSPPHRNTCSTRNVLSSTDNTIMTTTHLSYLTTWLNVTLSSTTTDLTALQLTARARGDTRHTLTPSVIPNSNYVIMVGDWSCLTHSLP